MPGVVSIIFADETTSIKSDDKTPDFPRYTAALQGIRSYDAMVKSQEIVYKNVYISIQDNIDGLVQERRNSSVLAMELCLFCTNLST